MTATAFAPLTEAEQIFHDLIWQPMIIAGETWVEIQVPFLALPVIKQLDEGTINIITEAMFNQICLFIDIESIQLINSAHQSAYDAASLQLKIVAQESGVTSDAYKTQLAVSLKAQSTWTNLAGGQPTPAAM